MALALLASPSRKGFRPIPLEGRRPLVRHRPADHRHRRRRRTARACAQRNFEAQSRVGPIKVVQVSAQTPNRLLLDQKSINYRPSCLWFLLRLTSRSRYVYRLPARYCKDRRDGGLRNWGGKRSRKCGRNHEPEQGTDEGEEDCRRTAGTGNMG